MSGPTDPAAHFEAVITCERDPDVETALSCGRCGVPICPQCMVHTPGGIRCPDCAMLRRPPMYELSTSHYLRAVGASLAIAAALGVAGAVLLAPTLRVGLLGMAIALIGGSAAGSALAAGIQRVTAGKRGLGLQLIAVSALGLAHIERLVLSGGLDLALRDVGGVFALVVAAAVAWGRLK